MAPAHQRLDARHPAGGEGDHRLELEEELVVLDGAAEVGGALEPAQLAAMPRRRVDLVAIAARRLRRVHGEVGVAEQLVDGAADAGDRAADAGAHEDLRAAGGEGHAEGAEDALGDPVQLLGAGAVEEHGELVAADVRHRVAGPDQATEPVGDADEQLVADAVTEGVVHRLEVVEVDDHDAERPGLAAAAGDRVGEAVTQQRAVGELGERIVEGAVAQLALQGGLLGDVDAQREDGGTLLEADPVEIHLGLDGAAVLEPVHLAQPACGGAHRARGAGERAPCRGDVRQPHAGELLAEVPVLDDGGVVGGEEVLAVHRVHPHRLRVGLEEVTEAALAHPEAVDGAAHQHAADRHGAEHHETAERHRRRGAAEAPVGGGDHRELEHDLAGVEVVEGVERRPDVEVREGAALGAAEVDGDGDERGPQRGERRIGGARQPLAPAPEAEGDRAGGGRGQPQRPVVRARVGEEEGQGDERRAGPVEERTAPCHLLGARHRAGLEAPGEGAEMPSRRRAPALAGEADLPDAPPWRGCRRQHLVPGPPHPAFRRRHASAFGASARQSTSGWTDVCPPAQVLAPSARHMSAPSTTDARSPHRTTHPSAAPAAPTQLRRGPTPSGRSPIDDGMFPTQKGGSWCSHTNHSEWPEPAPIWRPWRRIGGRLCARGW